jgi:hypothetical protein
MDMWGGRDTQELLYGSAMTAVGYGIGSLAPAPQIVASVVIAGGLSVACLAIAWLMQTLKR